MPSKRKVVGPDSLEVVWGLGEKNSMLPDQIHIYCEDRKLLRSISALLMDTNAFRENQIPFQSPLFSLRCSMRFCQMCRPDSVVLYGSPPKADKCGPAVGVSF